ncbi:MAG: ABC transporter transmembrane domain-containing protein, partial [Sphingomonadaceae bacterium]
MGESEAAQARPKKLGNLRLVWSYALAHRAELAGAALALLLAAAATLAIPDGFRRVIDQGFAGGEVARHFRYLLFIVVILAIATALRYYFVSWLGERVVADLRRDAHRHLLRLEPAFFEENRPSEIASRLTADTAVIETIVGTTVSVALRNLVIGIGGVAYLFALAPKLTAALLIAIPLVVLPLILLGRRIRAISRRSQDRIADVGAIVSETLAAMKIVQGFGQQEREATRFAGAVEKAFGTARRRIVLRALMTAVVIALVFGSITLVMWQAALDVAAGRLTGGTVAAFVFTGGLVAGAFGALTEVYGELLRGAGPPGPKAQQQPHPPAKPPPAPP